MIWRKCEQTVRLSVLANNGLPVGADQTDVEPRCIRYPPRQSLVARPVAERHDNAGLRQQVFRKACLRLRHGPQRQPGVLRLRERSEAGALRTQPADRIQTVLYRCRIPLDLSLIEPAAAGERDNSARQREQDAPNAQSGR